MSWPLSPSPADPRLAAPSLCPSATSCSQLAPWEAGPGHALQPPRRVSGEVTPLGTGQPPWDARGQGSLPQRPSRLPWPGLLRDGWVPKPPRLLKMTPPVSMATLLCLSPQTKSIIRSIIPAGQGRPCLPKGCWEGCSGRGTPASALLALLALPALPVLLAATSQPAAPAPSPGCSAQPWLVACPHPKLLQTPLLHIHRLLWASWASCEAAKQPRRSGGG